jgi:signal transduction histidine kinase
MNSMTAIAGIVTSLVPSLVSSLPAGLTPAIVLAIVVSAAGIWASWRHSTGAATALAAATGLALLPWLAAVAPVPVRLQLTLLASTPLIAPALAAAVVLWVARSERLDRRVRWTGRLLMISLGLAIAAVAIQSLGYDPFEHPSCRQLCVHVPSVLAPILGTRAALGLSTVLAIAAAAGATVAVLRSARRGVLAHAAVITILALAGLQMLRWLDFTAVRPQLSSWPLEPLTVAVAGAAATMLHLRIVRVRHAVGRLVDGLSPEAVVGGPVVDVQFAVDGQWLDLSGGPARTDPPTQRCVVLSDDDQAPMARLVLGGRIEPSEVLAGLTPAALLALRNAQLAAVAQSRLNEVRDSQRRVVAASDGERRRIERDLHDGAQQRLVGAGFQLRVAITEAVRADSTGRARREVERIECAEQKVREALTQLRRLAHGIFPGVLADEGLEPALIELLTASDVPADLDVRVTDEVAPDVAMAVYAMVATVLGGVTEPTAKTRAGVTIRQEDGMLTVRVDLDRQGAVVRSTDLTAVADRIGAVGGELVAEGTERLSAVIPCG